MAALLPVPAESTQETAAVTQHTPSPFLLGQPPPLDGTSRFFCVGRISASPPTASFPDGSFQLEEAFLDLNDPSRGLEEQRTSRLHAVLQLASDGRIFLRDWKARVPTRIFLPTSPPGLDSDFLCASPSSWTHLPHSARIHFAPIATPISQPRADPLPYPAFLFTVSSPSSHLPPQAPLPPLVPSPPGTTSAAGAISADLSDLGSDVESWEEDASGPRGLFGFKILLEGRQVGPVMGIKAATLHLIKTETGCRLSLSGRDSFFPGTSDRVLFVSGASSDVLAVGCAAVLNALSSDRGRDWMLPVSATVTLRAAYPSGGPFLEDCRALASFQADFPSCTVLLSSALHFTSDRVLSVHGGTADVAAAAGSLVRTIPHDAYSRMEADYVCRQLPPDRRQQRLRHQAAEKRKRRADEREVQALGAAKRPRGMANPVNHPSHRDGRRGGGKSRRS